MAQLVVDNGYTHQGAAKAMGVGYSTIFGQAIVGLTLLLFLIFWAKSQKLGTIQFARQ